MIIQRKSLIVSTLALLTLSMSAAFSAETIKKPNGVNKPTAIVNNSKSNVKNNLVKPGPSVGADEHGCIPPQIWHAASGTCVTDVLPGGGATQNGMQKE